MPNPSYRVQKCISLPRDLSQHMEAASEKITINWSRIAAQAFTEKLERMDSSDSDVVEVLERLEDISREIGEIHSRFETTPSSNLERNPKRRITKKKKRRERKSKYLKPVVRYLLKHPGGLTRKSICEGLKTTHFPNLKVDDLYNVLATNPKLITRYESLEEDDHGAFVYRLTELGKSKASTKKV